MEILLVRFTRAQRAFIRKEAKRTRRYKRSEAAVVRNGIDIMMGATGEKKP
jgi:hypothetical protein